MNSSKKDVTLYYKRGDIPVELPEWVGSTRRDNSVKKAKVGDRYTFFGDFYVDSMDHGRVASTVIIYEVKYVKNDETVIKVQIDCDFGENNRLELMGSIRAQNFKIKNRKLQKYETKHSTVSNLAIVSGEGDFKQTTGSAIYEIYGPDSDTDSYGKLYLSLNQ